MAKIEPVIKAELNPHAPVPEIMAIVDVMLRNNPGHEIAILQGVSEAVDVIRSRLAKKGEAANGK